MILKLFIWLGWSGIVVAAVAVVALAALGSIGMAVLVALTACALVIVLNRAEESLGEWSARNNRKEWRDATDPRLNLKI